LKTYRLIFAGVVFLVAFVVCGCAPSAYLTAVASYATTASTGVQSLAAVPSTESSICRKRAAARYVKAQVLTPSSTTWRAYYSASKQADGTLSWQEYCAEIETTGKNFLSLLTLLGAYSDAMKSLASAGSWDGATIASTITPLSSLVGGNTTAGKDLTNLASPAQKLGSFIVAGYTSGKTLEFAQTADPAVQAVLDGLGAHITAVNRDVVAPTQKERLEALELLEAKGGVWGTPLDAGRAITFGTYAKSVDDDIASIQSSFATYLTLIDKLKKAHTVLATKPASDASTNDIQSAVVSILAALTAK
jgi:hypothetical protein